VSRRGRDRRDTEVIINMTDCRAEIRGIRAILGSYPSDPYKVYLHIQGSNLLCGDDGSPTHGGKLAVNQIKAPRCGAFFFETVGIKVWDL